MKPKHMGRGRRGGNIKCGGETCERRGGAARELGGASLREGSSGRMRLRRARPHVQIRSLRAFPPSARPGRRRGKIPTGPWIYVSVDCSALRLPICTARKLSSTKQVLGGGGNQLVPRLPEVLTKDSVAGAEANVRKVRHVRIKRNRFGRGITMLARRSTGRKEGSDGRVPWETKARFFILCSQESITA